MQRSAGARKALTRTLRTCRREMEGGRRPPTPGLRPLEDSRLFGPSP